MIFLLPTELTITCKKLPIPAIAKIKTKIFPTSVRK